MKKLITASVVLAGVFTLGAAANAQIAVNMYEVWYTQSNQSGGSCSRDTNYNTTCVWAPNGNVAWDALSQAQGAAYFNYGTMTYVYSDGNTTYFTVAR
jgi:hypothetical protein